MTPFNEPVEMKSSNFKIEYQSKLKKYHKTKDNKHQRTKAQTLKRSTAIDFEVVILEFRSHDPGVLSFKLTCYKISLSANKLIPFEFRFPTIRIATCSQKLVALQQWNVQSQSAVPLQSIFSPRTTSNPNEPQRLSPAPCKPNSIRMPLLLRTYSALISYRSPDIVLYSR